MLAEGVPALDWLAYGQSFGLDEPIVLNLGGSGRYLWSYDKNNHCKYYWRDSFHFHLPLLIIQHGLEYRTNPRENESVKYMKEIPEAERPYEKCERLGAGRLTDVELLAVLLRTGHQRRKCRFSCKTHPL